MNDSMVFSFNWYFRKVFRWLGLWGYLGLLMLCLTGCPTQFEKFEQYYFQDRFIDAVILTHQETPSFDFSQKLNFFLNRNSKRLNKNLLMEINQFDASVSDEDLARLQDLIQALNYLQVTFPNTSLDYDRLMGAVSYVVDGYVAKKKFDINFLLQHHRYRQTRSALQLLQAQEPLLPTHNMLLEALEHYLGRQLFIEKIRVHDNDISDFKYEKAGDHYANYLQKGRYLVESSVDVPVEFFRHLDFYLTKEKSEFLDFHHDDEVVSSAHYRLVCSVGVKHEKTLIEERREIEDTFLVKFNLHSEWEEYPVFYEVFVTTTTYYASVDAAVYLGDMVIGHYIFDVYYPVEQVRVGEFLSLSNDILEMTYSQQYKDYKDVKFLREPSYYFQEVLDDAASVLVVKLLNTIDRDPDPYSLQYPFQFP